MASQPETAGFDFPVEVWTKIPPAGWTIDDSGVPGVTVLPDFNADGINRDDANTDGANDGITEFAGWSFAQVEWWNGLADQNRTQFTKANGGIMVVDPDEWDDAQHPAKGIGDGERGGTGGPG